MNSARHSFTPHRLSRRAKWDLAVGIAGLTFVLSTLLWTLSSPALSVLFVLLAGYELLAGHRAT
ncbi:MAG: hypothetical protein JST11_03665 [Acidobacteria bacterium]|nr:hypothetical protein [Acidobacteriota bacterium]